MIDLYEKIGNYTLDVSKYVFTGVVITTFFRTFDAAEYVIYLAGITFALAFMLIAFWSYSKHNEKIRKGGKS